ncbi:MAG: TRAP transporter small permease subunit [Clostridiales bacterium]|nr:TRAP transporter small permease subunit [Clostridiales bacterium]
MNFPAKIGNALTFANKKIAQGASLLIFPLIAIIVVEVFLRYFMGSPSIYAFDLQWMVCGTLVFLGGAYALAENVHVRADILYNTLRKRWQLLIDVVLYPVFFFTTMIALCYVTWGLFQSAVEFNEVSPMTSWRPIVWPVRLILFISMAMLLVQGVIKYITLIVNAPKEIRAEAAALAEKATGEGK